MNDFSKTDWTKVDALTDDEIDTSDIPPLDDAFFERAILRKPSTTITVHIDPDIVAWFKEQGADYERRMNVALRIYAEAHKTISR